MIKKHIGLVLILTLSSLGTATAGPGDGKTDSKFSNYKLQPMDLIKVQVFQEPDMDRDLRVSKDWIIVLPLIGPVDVKNHTVRETELMVTDLYKQDYLVNPQINITVTEYAQRTVNVFGAVNNPGAVQLPPEKEFSLLDAIARSGGFSRLANRARVSLTRAFPNGETTNYTINMDQLMAGDSNHKWALQSGDVVYVPERVL